MKKRKRICRVIAIVIATLCVGCNLFESRETSTHSPVDKHAAKSVVRSAESAFLVPPRRDRDGFLYAAVTEKAGKVPARFAAPLPSTLAECTGDWRHYPPRDQVAEALCAGEKSVFKKWTAAIDAAHNAGRLDNELADCIYSVARYCGSPALCRLLTAELDKESTQARALMLRGLADCKGAEIRRIMDRDETPDDVVIEWYFNQFDAHFDTLSPRFEKAATRTTKAHRGRDLRKLGVAMERFADPETAAFLSVLTRDVDEESGHWLAIGLGEHPSAEARARYQAACAHPVVGKDPMCRSTLPISGSSSAAHSEESLIWEQQIDETAWANTDKDHQQQTWKELLSCILDASMADWKRERCVETAVRIRPKQARTIAATLGKQSDLPDALTPITAALSRYATPGQLLDKLRAWGLIDPIRISAPDDPEYTPNPFSASALLDSFGRVHSFDMETDQFPNAHDALLVRLAHLTDGLEEIYFEEQAPHLKETDDRYIETGPYKLRAFMNGRVFETTATNNGDWYDVDTTIGFLNHLLKKRNSPDRAVLLMSDGQMATVLVAPARGIAAAVKEDIIHIAEGADAIAIGKAFEDKVFEKLKPENNGDVKRDVLFKTQ